MPDVLTFPVGPDMLTKTIRSRFNHEVGGTVEGCTILEKHVVIPPEPKENRRGVYDYVVEVPPAVVKTKTSSSRSSSAKAATAKSSEAPERGSFTRSTPEEMGGVIRRLPSR